MNLFITTRQCFLVWFDAILLYLPVYLSHSYCFPRYCLFFFRYLSLLNHQNGLSAFLFQKKISSYNSTKMKTHIITAVFTSALKISFVLLLL
ncbi:hypothetical protein BGW37DRAFT_482763 [Umbelopsis sp. PMI_123]|nr:hypothetical protein BGW37DRAFT_482763 [Umbelopsis sp. PMI_123]